MQNQSINFLRAAIGLFAAANLGFTAQIAVFTPGNLVVSRSAYQGTASTVTVGQALPPSCPATAKCPTKTATDNGAYPAIGSSNNVWNNAAIDGSFGITSPIFLDQYSTSGTFLSTFAVPTNLVTTSFPSKSEVALNLSDDGKWITFMGYVAPVNSIDVSNSNTPGVIDPTNPVSSAVYRAVVQLDAFGTPIVTNTNAYSGNNGRAAFLANGLLYMVGNSNNGGGTPANVVAAAGAHIAAPNVAAGAPREIGNFSITQVADGNGNQLYLTPDKLGKDNNFRGLTVFNNTMYVAKGSGGNGINTVYQVGNAGRLPTLANAANTPLTILPGFPTTLASAAGARNPFGLWFADANTLYVGDEGDGTAANAATSPYAGLQKWSLVNGVWQLDYVLQNGLNLGKPYSVPNYPTSLNPSPDGLRNITGKINGDGTVTIWGITSTVSANGDQGADPNQLLTITDVLANTSAAGAASEQFTLVKTAGYGEVLRGVSFAPGPAASASFVKFDSTTQGSWQGVYGADGAMLAGDGKALPAYATASAASARQFTWQSSTTDVRALQKVGSADRIAGTWYNPSTFVVDLNLADSNLHQLALYALDQDSTTRRQTVSIIDALTSRVLDTQTFANFHNGLYGVWNVQGHVLIKVTNAGGSNAVLSGLFLQSFTPAAPAPTASITAPAASSSLSLVAPITANALAGSGATIANVQFFANGSAISGKLSGAGPTYTFQWPTTNVANGTYSLTAVASDSQGQSVVSAPVSVTVANTLQTAVSFVADDKATGGTWQGKYGADGDFIAFDPSVAGSALPSYAMVAFNQGPPYLWAFSGAPQAMQERNAPASRIASTWFSPLSFTMDLNLTDGNTHQVALYFLDWDTAGRAETVSVIDANVNGSPTTLDTRSISNFGAGRYLVWNVRGHVLFQFNKTAGPNAVVGGLFFNTLLQ